MAKKVYVNRIQVFYDGENLIGSAEGHGIEYSAGNPPVTIVLEGGSPDFSVSTGLAPGDLILQVQSKLGAQIRALYGENLLTLPIVWVGGSV